MSAGNPRELELRVDDPGDAGKRLDQFIADRAGLFTRSQVRLRLRQASVNGSEARLGRRLRAGDVVRFAWSDPPPSTAAAEDIPLVIIHEDEEVIVVDKPQGMVVHPGNGNRSGTLVNALLHHCRGLSESFGTSGGRPGIVHRLDKDTSGVMACAKSPGAQAFLSAQFKGRTVRKRYLALVQGIPASREGTIDAPIARDRQARTRFRVVRAGGRASVTRWRVLKSWTVPVPAGARGKAPVTGTCGYALLLCSPRTGRTHQIRVHLRHLGTPVLGDPVYGRRDPLVPGATLMLHARSLGIVLPGESERSVFRSALPERFRRVLRVLQSFSPR